jgi:hypothetical protein
MSFLWGCAAGTREPQDTPETGIKSGRYSVKRENSDLAVIIDLELATRRLAEKYLPLIIKIANKQLYTVTISRDSLILIEENGEGHLMPDIFELQKNYDKLVPDNKFKRQTGLLGDQVLTSFSYFQKADSKFFPEIQGGARVIDTIALRKTSYMEDLIYFPMPGQGVKGKKLTFRLDAFELEKPFDLIFTID